MAAKTYTYDDLMADLKNSKYTPKTQEELQKEAATRYDSTYAEKELAARQATATSTAALEQQIASLGSIFDKREEESKKAYDQTYSKADRTALSRNMGRSTYNLATLANISNEGNKALQGIADEETAARTGLDEKKTLLATQLADQLKQYATGKTSDTNAYLDELLTREYDRTQDANTTSNNIAKLLYDLGYQTERDKINDALNQEKLAEEKRQFDKLHPTKTSGGGKTTKPPPPPAPPPGDAALESLLGKSKLPDGKVPYTPGVSPLSSLMNSSGYTPTASKPTTANPNATSGTANRPTTGPMATSQADALARLLEQQKNKKTQETATQTGKTSTTTQKTADKLNRKNNER